MQLSRDDLLGAYRRMATIRQFEERLHEEIKTGEIAGFTHLYCGQEAAAVGVCDHLTDDDYIVSTHRGHGHCIAKGCDVKGMMKRSEEHTSELQSLMRITYAVLCLQNK